jgi:hypothetical protein
MFYLRSGLKAAWLDMDLPDNTVGWRSEWFYITDKKPMLPKRTAHKLVKINKWDLQVTSREMDDVKELLTLVGDLKKAGLTGGVVAMSFCRHMIQPIKDRVHPAYEYWGQMDPTREVTHKVSQEDMAARVSQMYFGCIRNKKCPKAYSLSRPADPVSFLKMRS